MFTLLCGDSMQTRRDEEYYNKMIEAYIGKEEETLWYQLAFSKFNFNGVDTIRWNWSWWAFGLGFLFLLYRKQYTPALLLFFISVSVGIIPFMSIVIMVLSGGYSTYFVYKGFKSKLLEVEANIEDEETRIKTMREVGGYNQWVVWLYIGFILLMGTMVLIMISPFLMQ